MKYIALLRGINVGGNHKVEMARLKIIFENLGYAEIRTYINSGNIIFQTTDKKETLEKNIEAAIKKEFHFDVPVVVISAQQLAIIEKTIPKNWKNDAEQKTDVLFLWSDVDKKDVLEQVTIKENIDDVRYIKGAVVWHVERKDVTRSGLLKIIGTPLYKKVTIRNVNTVRKLQQLLAE